MQRGRGSSPPPTPRQHRPTSTATSSRSTSARSRTVDVVDRVVTDRGELVLRHDGDNYEVVSNGVFLMDTRDGRSERLLVTAAFETADRVDRVLIGGLGVGFSLAAAVADERVRSVTVVEV